MDINKDNKKLIEPVSELRHDPIQRRWVIVATARGGRPHDFSVIDDRSQEGKFCPFCPGNEHKTPKEILAYRDPNTEPNTPGWELRVIPNKFPALAIEGELNRQGFGLYDKMRGLGAHEVVVETPNHDQHMADMPLEHLVKVIYAYRERLEDLMKDTRFRYVLIFKNWGLTAGASLSHPHTQIIATPITPRTVAIELQSAQDHFRVKERCLFCDMIAQEVASNERIIQSNNRFLAIAPYASRFPFESFIIPKRHSYSFTEIDDDGIWDLARMLKDILGRLKIYLKDPPFNWLLHTSPNINMTPKRPGYWQTIQFDYHWHIEVIPRLTKMAGFEWGTGFYINPTPPETAAEELRAVDLTKDR